MFQFKSSLLIASLIACVNGAYSGGGLRGDQIERILNNNNGGDQSERRLGGIHTCSAQENCIEWTVNPAPGDSTCSFTDGTCKLEVCLVLKTGTDNSLCAKDGGVVSHVCDNAGLDKCPKGPGDANWDKNDASPACPTTGAHESVNKCNDVLDGFTMCQHGSPGDKLYWILKDASGTPDTVSKGDGSCGNPHIQCKVAGQFNVGGANVGDCGGNGASKEMVWEYTVPRCADKCGLTTTTEDPTTTTTTKEDTTTTEDPTTTTTTKEKTTTTEDPTTTTTTKEKTTTTTEEEETTTTTEDDPPTTTSTDGICRPDPTCGKPDPETCWIPECINGVCGGSLVEVDSNLDITFNPNTGFFVYYAENPFNKPWNIGLQFDYSTYHASGDYTNELFPVDFAAIIFGGDKPCGDRRAQILADVTTGADPVYASTYQTLGTPVFDLLINTTDPIAPFLEIKTPFENFGPPFWDQNYLCTGGSTEGGFGTSAGDQSGPDFQETCGMMHFCVEFQVLLCNKKIDFVDVKVKIELDIESQCEDDACGDVIMARAAPQDAEGKFAADYPIKCEPCDPDDPFEATLSQTVEQGEVMKACISLAEPQDGVCILLIEDLDLMITPLLASEAVPYQIVPVCPTPLCLFPATGYINLDPTEYLDVNGATVSFLPPAWWFQEVTYGDSMTGTFKGSVVLGFGCYCDPTSNCKAELVGNQGSRKLQQEDQVVEVGFEGQPFGFSAVQNSGPASPPGPATNEGCSVMSFLS